MKKWNKEKLTKHKTLWQTIKYALCTASAGLIEFLSYTILHEVMKGTEGTVHFIDTLEVNVFVPTLVALFLSILWNFTLNRKVTFRSAGNVPRAMFLAFLFYVPFFPFKLWANCYIPQYITFMSEDGAEFFVELCTMLLNGVLEFCWQKFVIYRKEEDTAEKKEKTEKPRKKKSRAAKKEKAPEQETNRSKLPD